MCQSVAIANSAQSMANLTRTVLVLLSLHRRRTTECNVVVSKINVVEDILSAECLEVVLFFPLDRKK